MLLTSPQWKIPNKHIQIQSKNIHIWIANLLVRSSVYLKDFKQCLSQDELDHAARYNFEKDMKYYIASRGILRKILSNYLMIEPKEIRFLYNAYGKPRLCNKLRTENFYFNVSHSGDLVLYIFSPTYEVGIDLEKLRLIEDFLDIANQFFSPNEYSKLKFISHNQQLEAFFKCWTRKEAFIKAIGNGLSYPLDQFEVTLDPKEPTTFLNILGNSTSALEWSLYSLTPTDDYEAAFAFKGECERIEYFQYVDFIEDKI